MYAGLAASLFSTSLTMLGKQWLNQSTSTDTQAPAIKHGRSQQRQLNGIVGWYSEYLMGLLLSTPQVPALLLCCALSRYLWRIDTTVTGVVLDVTSFGVISHFLVLAAGVAFRHCAYQIPGSHILRSGALAVVPVTSTVVSTLRRAVRHSETINLFRTNVANYHPLLSGLNAPPSFVDIPCKLPAALVTDTFHLGRTTVQPLVGFVHQMYYTQLLGAPSTPVHPLGQQTALDLKHISWMLQSSLDNNIQLSTLDFLSTIVTLDDLNPTIVVDCFNILIDCIEVVDSNVVITQGLEQLATISAMCFFRTFSHLSAANPTSTILTNVSQHYKAVFPSNLDLQVFPFYHTLGAIHRLLNSDWKSRQQAGIGWENYKPSMHEHVVFACALTKLAWFEYQRREGWEKKVPRWILRFALHSLSLDPLPPASVIIDCLSIIAIDLGCDVSTTRTMAADKRYVCT